MACNNPIPHGIGLFHMEQKPSGAHSTRVMLLLDRRLARAAEMIAQQISRPGFSANRQDAIRHVLAKLADELDAEAMAPMLAGKAAPSRTPRKRMPA